MAIVLVTETSSGIGFATAVSLARRGHKVIATMRSLRQAEELRDAVLNEDLPITLAELDVTDDASVERLFSQTIAEHEHLDVLVNNTGIRAWESVEELPLAAFREIMETNFFGALRCIKAALPGMRQRRHGCIINVSSVVDETGMVPAVAHAVSNRAFETINGCLAREVKAFDVRVVILESGVAITSTPRIAGAAPEGRLRAPVASSLTNTNSPDEVEKAICEIVDGCGGQLGHRSS